MVRVWEAVSGAHKRTMSGHTGPILSVAFSPDGSQLISASHDRTMRVWNPASDAMHSSSSHRSWIMSVAFSPYGSQISSRSNDGTKQVWDGFTGTLSIWQATFHSQITPNLHKDR
jgi:WD40 repeat protein